MKYKLWLFYHKWIKKECPHFCKFCSVRYKEVYGDYWDCMDEWEEDYMRHFLGYRETPLIKTIFILLKAKLRKDK